MGTLALAHTHTHKCSHLPKYLFKVKAKKLNIKEIKYERLRQSLKIWLCGISWLAMYFSNLQVLGKWTKKWIYLSIISPDDLIFDCMRGEMRYDE